MIKKMIYGIAVVAIVTVVVTNLNFGENSTNVLTELSLKNIEAMSDENAEHFCSWIDEKYCVGMGKWGNGGMEWFVILVYQLMKKNIRIIERSKNMKKKYLFIVLFILFSCCKEKINNNSLICIDNPQESKYLSSVFKSFKIIRLETTDESLTGKIIVKIKKTKDAYYIACDFRFLLKFDHNGKFIRKITHLGNGPGEYIQLNNFDISDSNDDILLLDVRKVHIYDSTGVHKTTIPLKIGGFDIKDINSKNFIIGKSDGSLDYNIYLCDYSGKVLDKQFERNKLPTLGCAAYWGKDTILYKIDYSNNLICYDKTTNKFFEVDFLCNKEFLSVKEELKLKNQYSDDVFKYSEYSSLNLINTICSYSDYLYFNTGNETNGFNHNYIVNRNNKKIECFYTDKIVNDINFTEELSFSSSTFGTEAEDCFVTYAYLDQMFEGMEKQQDKFKDNQHFISLYKELSEIKNKEDENLALIELKIE
jgi:hypothetical protein